jgi:hypothetical protein
VDWSAVTLLHEQEDDAWPDWLMQFVPLGLDLRLRRAEAAPSLYFSHIMLAVGCAVQQGGALLAPRCLVEQELADGQLIEWLTGAESARSTALVRKDSFHFVHAAPEERALSAPAALLKKWLIAQV